MEIIEDDVKNYTISKIRAKLNGKYQKIKKRNDEGTSEYEGKGETEAALYGSGGFKGRCYNCGKYGHKSEDCPEKKRSNNGKGRERYPRSKTEKFNGKCFFCGKWGHTKAECRERKKMLQQQGNDSANFVEEAVLMTVDETVSNRCSSCCWWNRAHSSASCRSVSVEISEAALFVEEEINMEENEELETSTELLQSHESHEKTEDSKNDPETESEVI